MLPPAPRVSPEWALTRTVGRKVRAPQGMMPGNTRDPAIGPRFKRGWAAGDRKRNRKYTARPLKRTAF